MILGVMAIQSRLSHTFWQTPMQSHEQLVSNNWSCGILHTQQSVGWQPSSGQKVLSGPQSFSEKSLLPFNQLLWEINKDKQLPICTLAATRLWTVPWRRTPSRFRLQLWSHFTQQLNSLFGCYLIWVLDIIAEISLVWIKSIWINYMWIVSGFHGLLHITSQIGSEVFFALRWAALPSWLADMLWQHDGSWNWPWTWADFSQRLNLRTDLGDMQELALLTFGLNVTLHT